MDESDAMCRAGRDRRNPVKLQSGDGYARGGRVAMSRVEGRVPPGMPAGATYEPAHIDVPLPGKGARPPMRGRRGG